MSPPTGRVPRVPPISFRQIEMLAEEFLQVVHPWSLQNPSPLDLLFLVDEVLPRSGIHFYPVSKDELCNEEAHTKTAGDGPIDVLMEASQFDALESPGPASHRPRATAAHEIGHAVLHVEHIRRARRLRAEHELVLSREQERRMRPFEDPEWQAWAFAGCILVPRRTLDMLPPGANASEVYRVSDAFLRAHVGRLRRSRSEGRVR